MPQAQGEVKAARGKVPQERAKAWKCGLRRAPGKPERGTAAPARRFAHRACREAVQLLYDAMGSAAIYTERTPLDRCLRDVITAGRHVAPAEKVLDGVGDLRLGGAPGSPHF
ncbi:hypothetical protein ACIQOV_32840 [Kitasatospora sp. NPDC091257]|uniref:hypothetical protein n=1 Tax=Kitasatospora sp. NPDC091257 TaxID=3364084 RepID=UPI0037FC2B64